MMSRKITLVTVLLSVLSLTKGLTQVQWDKFTGNITITMPAYSTNLREKVAQVWSISVAAHDSGIALPTLAPVWDRQVTANINNDTSPASAPSCIETDRPIGFAVNGVPLFGPYNNAGQNVVTSVSVPDSCGGYVNTEGIYQGVYHYRKIPTCLKDSLFRHNDTYMVETGERLIGVAIDGYPIYVEYDANATTGLDACHCKTDLADGMRYYMTDAFPYIIGCLRGKVLSSVWGDLDMSTTTAAPTTTTTQAAATESSADNETSTTVPVTQPITVASPTEAPLDSGPCVFVNVTDPTDVGQLTTGTQHQVAPVTVGPVGLAQTVVASALLLLCCSMLTAINLLC